MKVDIRRGNKCPWFVGSPSFFVVFWWISIGVGNVDGKKGAFLRDFFLFFGVPCSVLTERVAPA